MRAPASILVEKLVLNLPGHFPGGDGDERSGRGVDVDDQPHFLDHVLEALGLDLPNRLPADGVGELSFLLSQRPNELRVDLEFPEVAVVHDLHLVPVLDKDLDDPRDQPGRKCRLPFKPHGMERMAFLTFLIAERPACPKPPYVVFQMWDLAMPGYRCAGSSGVEPGTLCPDVDLNAMAVFLVSLGDTVFWMAVSFRSLCGRPPCHVWFCDELGLYRRYGPPVEIPWYEYDRQTTDR